MDFTNGYEQSEFESACAAQEVADPGGRRLRIPERLLQCLWYDQFVRRGELATEDGRPVVVLSPGEWSLTGGPDFRHARLRIGNETLSGDVEVHLRSSDWHRHGHSADSAYAGVILHVVYEHDAAVPCLSALRREEIPTLILAKHLPGDIEHLAQVVDVRGYPGEGSGGLGACHRHLEEEPGAFAAALRVVEEAGDARFARLARRMGRRMETADPEEALYRGVLEGLGFRRNRVAFAELSRRMPWDRLRAAAADAAPEARVLKIQAALFGAAGMLDTAHPPDAETAAYRQALAREWENLRARGGLSPLPDGLWRLRNVRPLNHPARRIGGAAHVLAERVRGGLVPDLLDRAGDPPALTRFFEPQPDGYWSRRAGFGPAAFAEPVRPIGDGLARTIALNVLLPFAAALARRRRDPAPARAALRAFRAFPALADNAATGFVLHRMLGARRERRWREWRRALGASARRGQGLLQIFKDRCGRGAEGCDGCPVVAAMRTPDAATTNDE
jgi:hypothetical protein